MNQTGGQPTSSDIISINKIAKACNYEHVFTTSTSSGVLSIFEKIKQYSGPIMIVIKVKKGKSTGKRISTLPIKIKEDFIRNL